ncbi:HAD-IIA family hydrolase [Anaerolentibacter hominis]|uniref:HAD-IIA family hydrolase n=1 Tax=Anaerolentibacter hominis TaxID=3079009 RepID=UPI0031B810ED
MERLTKGTSLTGKRLFLLDIDGTISFDATPIDGTMDFVRRVQEKQGKYVFITNNSTKGMDDYVTKFTKMGIPVDESNFLTSSYATAWYLKKTYGNELLFVLGTKSFIRELESFGLRVTEELEEGIRAAVVGFDNELNYGKVEKICELLFTREVDYIATNPDLACPVGFGFVPDCGAICDFIGKAAGREPVYIGKPNRLMVDMALEANQASPEETVVIGDRLYTDIACGINGGVETIAVFTGEAKLEDLSDTQFPPTYYCDSIRDIFECM